MRRFLLFRSAQIFLVLSLSGGAGSLWADDDSSYGEEFTQAFNINPAGIALGSYSANYEILFDQTHGVVLEGTFTRMKNGSDSGDSTTKGGGFGLQYRWHWSDAMESGFLGVFARYTTATGTGSATTNVNGFTSASNFDIKYTAATLGLNIGKRWVWESGFNIVFRIGYGYTKLDITTWNASSDISGTIDALKPVLQLIAGIDGELSIGYAF